jgi:hypothetical protein
MLQSYNQKQNNRGGGAGGSVLISTTSMFGGTTAVISSNGGTGRSCSISTFGQRPLKLILIAAYKANIALFALIFRCKLRVLDFLKIIFFLSLIYLSVCLLILC